ncbi:hypothetical protein KGD82_13550 [Nocardiopsis eucommiae]|uniref:Uncharacterized protein n=1 Tax=Nocardiopsis eucommiae TaxID=2831970 RepID=A0A975LBN6_9ACTN|nr:hypothetical protein KGD82_13550 [Nocardiopsis eucommiae]
MTESQGTQDIQAQAREAILSKIASMAPLAGNPGGVKDLAEAYALVVSVDEEEVAGSAYDR